MNNIGTPHKSKMNGDVHNDLGRFFSMKFENISMGLSLREYVYGVIVLTNATNVILSKQPLSRFNESVRAY